MSASVSKDKKGYRINLRLPCGKTTCLRGKRLGIGQNQKALETVRFHISNLIAAKQTSTPIPGETCAWLERIGKALYRKLCVAGRADLFRIALGAAAMNATGPSSPPKHEVTRTSFREAKPPATSPVLQATQPETPSKMKAELRDAC